MATLTMLEKRQLERVLQMGSGYVPNFSDRTFREFVADSTGRDAYEERYNYARGSKANRLRGFWAEEEGRIVGKLLGDLFDYAESKRGVKPNQDLPGCRRTVVRLMQGGPVPEIDAITATTDERDFEMVAKAVKETIAYLCHEVRAHIMRTTQDRRGMRKATA
jgi:hypothetical protein